MNKEIFVHQFEVACFDNTFFTSQESFETFENSNKTQRTTDGPFIHFGKYFTQDHIQIHL